MAGRTLLLVAFVLVACTCVSSRGIRGFKFPLPPPPPPGCTHRGSFYEVGEIFSDKWCTKYCTCKEPGVTACRAICPMEWIECGEGLQAEMIYEPVMDGMCSCPRHVCVVKE